jgi:hypothetical protein
MRAALATACVLLGIAAVRIGVGNFVLGPAAVAHGFQAVLQHWSPGAAPPALAGADIDSELRFYSVFWMAWGTLVIRAADPRRGEAHRLPWLLALFLAGGLGRALGWALHGPPSLLFQILMWIELGLAPLLIAWSLLSGRAARPETPDATRPEVR